MVPMSSLLADFTVADHKEVNNQHQHRTLYRSSSTMVDVVEGVIEEIPDVHLPW